MPYEWRSDPPGTTRLQLWPHHSLTRGGFVWFIGITAGLTLLPALALLGTPLLWALLPFPALAIAGIWWALRRNQRDRAIIEDLTLTPDQMALVRHGPGRERHDWAANPHWVQVSLHAQGGPVPNYLTLRGNGREVELGAFLSEDERLALCADLRGRLTGLRLPPVDAGG